MCRKAKDCKRLLQYFQKYFQTHFRFKKKKKSKKVVVGYMGPRHFPHIHNY